MSSSSQYKSAGVDIDAGERLVERIKPHAKKTLRPEVIGSLGGFAGLCEIPSAYQQPLLIAATDGVGTKLKLAIELGIHSSIGIDLVAMCVNDLVVTGAEPLFFLDYFATSALDVDVADEVIAGVCQGCEQAGAALLGGETAEMPGLYQAKDYDLAGFAVGVVEKSRVISGKTVKEGDVLLGISSAGLHANGFSLVNKIIKDKQVNLTETLEGRPLGEQLLTPTRIYVKSLLGLFKVMNVKALAHITGGGLIENLPRVLPQDCQAVIDSQAWNRPAVFDWLQQTGDITAEEMLRVFNCGLGMVLCVSATDEQKCMDYLQQSGEKVWKIGVIETNQGATNQPTPQVVIQ